MKFIAKTNKLIHFLFISLSSPIIVASQECILACFIGSFYFGIYIYDLWKQPVDLADISFMIIIFAYFSFLLVPSAKLPKINNTIKPLFYSLCAFVAWCIVSSLLNLSRHSAEAGWQSIWFVFNFIQLPIGLYIFSSPSLQKYRSFILSVILCFSILEIGVALVQVFFLSSIPATGTFSIHHAMIGNMMVFSAAISIYRLLLTKKMMHKIAFGILFTFSLFTIIFSETRSILLGVAIALFIYLIHFLRFSWKNIFIIGMSLVLLLAIIKVTPLEKIINRTIRSKETPVALDMSSFGRLLIWKGSVEHFLKAPITEKLIGCGPGKFKTIPFSFFVFDRKGSSGAHNNFLHALIETGILGFVFYIIFFSVALYSLFKHSKTDPLAGLFFYGTIALLGSGLSQETFWMQFVFGNLWLFHTVLLGLIVGKPISPGITKEK